jgi:hypothetical protein
MSEDNQFDDLEQMRRRLQQTGDLPFSELLAAEMVAEAMASLGVTFRERVYTPAVTLWTFLSQVLSQDHSCRDAVGRLLAWRLSQGLGACSTKGHSYCEARKRLPVEVLQKLVRDQARELEARAKGSVLWKGHHVKIVDGTTVTMPDTPANQAAYPRRRNQARGVGFPIARVLTILSLAYGTVLDAAMGPMRGKKTGENTLFRSLFSSLQEGDVLLGDSLFPSYRDIATLRRQGVDVVARQNATRNTDFRCGRWLGTLDHVVVWKRPSFDSARFDRAEWAALPEEMEVRELRFQVEQAGFRPREIIVVTTLLDPLAYPKEDLCGLYRERWHCELDLRSIKTSLRMAHLRCKTPAMVEKEVWTHFLAYNLMRQTMAEAARSHDVLPRHLSFKGACQMVNSFATYLALQPALHKGLWHELLRAIATHIVGDRPDRVEPRKLKYRPGKYTYMTRPRNEERQRCCA